MEKDLMQELGKAMNDAISAVLKENNIPSAVLQAKITINGGEDWMAIGGAISGTQNIGVVGGGGVAIPRTRNFGGGGGYASGFTDSSGIKPE